MSTSADLPEQVNVREAKTQLSALLARVEAGEEFAITRAGKPIARLGRYSERPCRSKPGFDEGRIWVSDGFNDPRPLEIQSGFDALLP